MTANNIPIIAIDGTAASGKGAIAEMLAKHFNFNYLNSGALYRIVAHQVKHNNISLDDHKTITEIGASIAPIFYEDTVLLNGDNIWPIIKTQEYGNIAASISSIHSLRGVIYNLQRAQIAGRGLVAEGRDMTSHVFIDAHVKLYLDADINARADRRHKDELRKYELDSDHIIKDLEQIRKDIENRDYSDINREHGRLFRTDDSHYIDNTKMNKEQTFEHCRDICNKVLSGNGFKLNI